MTPVLVTAPTVQPVSLEMLKDHLRMRISDTEDDALIGQYSAQAVAYLDGWTGVLGRCIMPQTWRVTAKRGQVVLPMPDVTSATAAYEAGATGLEVEVTAGGPCVTLTEDADIDFLCAMPAHLLPSAQTAVKLLVAHYYDETDLPDAFHSVVTAMRWRQL